MYNAFQKTQRNIFNTSPHTPGSGNGIYSVTGKPSLRISRRPQPNSNVFPVGCMGNKGPDPSGSSMSQAYPLPDDGLTDKVVHVRHCISDGQVKTPTEEQAPAVEQSPGEEQADQAAAGEQTAAYEQAAAEEQNTANEQAAAEEEIPAEEYTSAGVAPQGAGDNAAAKPANEYHESNIKRNPLTGRGCGDLRMPTGKRRVKSKLLYKRKH